MLYSLNGSNPTCFLTLSEMILFIIGQDTWKIGLKEGIFILNVLYSAIIKATNSDI